MNSVLYDYLYVALACILLRFHLFLYYRKGYCLSDFLLRLVNNFTNNSINMWWEILPSVFIIGLIPVAPQILTYYMNQFALGNPMRRDMRDIWDRHMYTRDARLSGAPWKHRGLEDIPDD